MAIFCAVVLEIWLIASAGFSEKPAVIVNYLVVQDKCIVVQRMEATFEERFVVVQRIAGARQEMRVIIQEECIVVEEM